MGFLIRSSFWFSLVLLFLPLSSAEDGGQPAVGPLQALGAARDAIGDLSGMCEREPEVCETGRAAFQTIGVRARESARIAYELLGDDPHAQPSEVDAPAGSAAEPQAPDATIKTGGVATGQ